MQDLIFNGELTMYLFYIASDNRLKFEACLEGINFQNEKIIAIP